MKIVKVIIKKTVYEMTEEQAKGNLNVAKKLVPCGIYAVQKGDTIELKNQPYVYKQNLRKAVAEYVKRGFKVYYNGG
jgi:ABC-type molybdate transport system substrate-binding protein